MGGRYLKDGYDQQGQGNMAQKREGLTSEVSGTGLSMMLMMKMNKQKHFSSKIEMTLKQKLEYLHKKGEIYTYPALCEFKLWMMVLMMQGRRMMLNIRNSFLKSSTELFLTLMRGSGVTNITEPTL